MDAITWKIFINILHSHKKPLSSYNGVNLGLTPCDPVTSDLSFAGIMKSKERGAVPDAGDTQLALLRRVPLSA